MRFLMLWVLAVSAATAWAQPSDPDVRSGPSAAAGLPTIIADLGPVTVREGGDVTLALQAAGADLHYEWRFNGNRYGRTVDAPVLTLTNVTSAVAGLWTVRVQNGAGTVTAGPGRLTVCAPAVDSGFQGRPWVRLFASEDPVPGTVHRFGPLKTPFEPVFTLWNGTLHATARANDNRDDVQVLHTALVRWRDGVLSTLVFTNDPVPGATLGETFVYPFYPTDEGGGAVNFAYHEMYEIRGDVIARVVDTNTPAPGRPGVTLAGPGSFARRGDAVMLSASLRNADGSGAGSGVYLLRAGTLTRLADNTTDLPGVMSGYGGRPTEDSVNFDGVTAVFSTAESLQGPGGVYRAALSGEVTKLLDTGDRIPGMTNEVAGFGDVDVEGGMVFAVVGIRVSSGVQNRIVGFEADGTARLIGNGDYLVASGPRQVVFGASGSISRWTDGATETVIGFQTILDCRRVKRYFDVDAQGDDIAVGVEFQDGVVGVYGNFGNPSGGAPRILAPPRPVAVGEGAPARFAVAATGSAPLTFRWRRDGQDIPGATQPVLVLPATGPGDVADYDVVVGSPQGEVTVGPVALTLEPGPAKPVGFGFLPGTPNLVPAGGSLLLTALAAGAPPRTYQWRRGGVPLDGQTGPTLALAGLTAADHGGYDVIVGGPGGSITNSVSVFVVPVITTQPVPATAAPGGSAAFSVVAAGFAEYRYSWFKDGLLLPGRTNATLELENIQSADTGYYQANVIGVGGTAVRSTPVLLTVGGGGGGPGAVVLGLPEIGPGVLRFTLPTGPGIRYRIERSPSLAPAQWTPVEVVDGDGTPRTVPVPVDGDQGYVRVVVPPG